MTKIFKSSDELLKNFWDNNLASLTSKYAGVSFRYFCESFELSHLKIPEFLKKINDGVPLDYISKNRHFAGFDFYVDERVLIPRFETEILYEIVLNEIKKIDREYIKVAEVGVGSGCIALSLLASCQKKLNFWCGDIDEGALEVFSYNMFKLKNIIPKQHEVEVSSSDRLIEAKGKVFDLIVSNPPYIKDIADKNEVHSTTLDYEPTVALFLEDESYEDWFLRLFTQAFTCLDSNGCFMMEGHEKHLQKLKELAMNSACNWKSAEIIKDYTQRDRFIVLRK